MTPVLTYVKGKGWVYETTPKARQLKRPEVNGVVDKLVCVRCGQPGMFHNYADKYHGRLWDDDILTCRDDEEPGLFEL